MFIATFIVLFHLCYAVVDHRERPIDVKKALQAISIPIPINSQSIFENVGRIDQDQIVSKLFHKRTASLSSRKDISYSGRSDNRKMHKIIIAVKQSNLEILENFVHDVSDPDSPNFGLFKSRHEILALTEHSASSEYIVRFLKRYWKGKSFSIEKNIFGEYISVTAPIGLLEDLFKATFEEYSQISPGSSTPETFHRAEEISLPVTLAVHIHSIFLAVDFPPITLNTKHSPQPNRRNMRGEYSNEQKWLKKPTDSSKIHTTANGYVTPAILNSVYSITNNSGSFAVAQDIYASIGQTFSPSDLSLFQSHFGLPQQAISGDINGHVSDAVCQASVNNCDEANLDVQYIMAISQGTPTTFYYWNSTSDLWESFLVNLANRRASLTTPLVVSISYASVETQLSSTYLHSFNVEVLKLAAQGVTLIAASGDNGVNCASGLCNANSAVCGYYPSFPASSPFVTAVGATQGPESNSAEVACSSSTNGVITTGGGFSATFRTPSWQQSVVSQYLNSSTGKSAASGYNSLGRGYPDVSLLGRNYLVYLNGVIYSLFGTSASAPVFAGMVSLVNAARVAVGKGGLGWINPTLYKYSSQFINDVTTGNNECVVGGSCCSTGFTATTGWDPVTGLGSVNFANFKSVLVGLGNNLNIPTLPPTQAPAVPTTVAQPVASAKPSTTTMPTSSNTGWMYKYTYSTSSCSGTVIDIFAVPLGVCLHNFKLVGSSVYYSGYQMYSCNNGVPSVSYFYGAGCTFASGNFNKTISYSTGCNYEQDTEYYYTESHYYSTILECSSASSYQSILPALGGSSYAINTLYNDNSCTTVSAVQAFVQGTCTNLDDALNGFLISEKSYKISMPYLYFYYGTNCGSSYSYFTVSTGTCYSPFKYFTGSTELTQMWTTYTTPTSTPTTPSSYSPTVSNIVSTIPPSNSQTYAPSLSPSTIPTAIPSTVPTTAPSTTIPTIKPTVIPTILPSILPTVLPTALPSAVPSTVPTTAPSTTAVPTIKPTVISTILPSILPTVLPTAIPSVVPSIVPTSAPIYSPTSYPSFLPTLEATVIPTGSPSISTTVVPSLIPTIFPSLSPSILPLYSPTLATSVTPSLNPSETPSQLPSLEPSFRPITEVSIAAPTDSSTDFPTNSPSTGPTIDFSTAPTESPSSSPLSAAIPTNSYSPSTESDSLGTDPPATVTPSTFPTFSPSDIPIEFPTSIPITVDPTIKPIITPTILSTNLPSLIPTAIPSAVSSTVPTTAPFTTIPTIQPTAILTMLPSILPTVLPTAIPSVVPSTVPTTAPSTTVPTIKPTVIPTILPSILPTVLPTALPSAVPSTVPTTSPTTTTIRPTIFPTLLPTVTPSVTPTATPSAVPSTLPTFVPSYTISSIQPNIIPTFLLSSVPSTIPSATPSTTAPIIITIPTNRPTTVPTLIPTIFPSVSSTPTAIPSAVPSILSTTAPSITIPPTFSPSFIPSLIPTKLPTATPSTTPTVVSTTTASIFHPTTAMPTIVPSIAVTTNRPSTIQTSIPSIIPSVAPSYTPSSLPTAVQTSSVSSNRPSVTSTIIISSAKTPTVIPSKVETKIPTIIPSHAPNTKSPTRRPSIVKPSHIPTAPTYKPKSSKPTFRPTSFPSTIAPSMHRTDSPHSPSTMISAFPSILAPTHSPTSSTLSPRKPSLKPFSKPSSKPTGKLKSPAVHNEATMSASPSNIHHPVVAVAPKHLPSSLPAGHPKPKPNSHHKPSTPIKSHQRPKSAPPTRFLPVIEDPRKGHNLKSKLPTSLRQVF